MAYDDAYERVIARNYDAVYSVIREPSGDAAFYRDLARKAGGPILELGCGTGRVLIPIADEGIECVGLDSSPEMLAVLRAKQPPACLSLVEGRMERFDLGDRRFHLVTAPFRAFSDLLDVDAQLACLACIRRHLVPGGLFAFDLFDPKLARTALAEEPEQLAVTFRRRASGARGQRRRAAALVLSLRGRAPARARRLRRHHRVGRLPEEPVEGRRRNRGPGAKLRVTRRPLTWGTARQRSGARSNRRHRRA
jgi:SAM-dependent methyltransferase